MNDIAGLTIATLPSAPKLNPRIDDRKDGFGRQLFNLVTPYWRSEEKVSAWILLTMVLVLNLGLVYVSYLLNIWNGHFYDALQSLNKAAYISLVLSFIWLVALFIFVAVTGTYVNDYLTLRWRMWLTKQVMADWLHNSTFCKLFTYGAKTENPDQRISVDLAIFTTSSLSLSVGIISQLVRSVTFSALLWSLSKNLKMPLPGGRELDLPGYMLWLSLIYVFFATVAVFKTGRPLVGLDYTREKVEADFRFNLMRIRERRDEVAILKGSEAEEKYLNSNINSIIKNFKQIILRNVYVNGLQYFFINATTILPLLAGAPAFFAGAITLGVLMQMSNAFSQVNSSLGVFSQQYQELASWKATFNRIVDFRGEMAELRHKVVADDHKLEIVSNAEQHSLKIEDLKLHLPNSTALVTFNFAVQEREHVLLMGRSGLGKTTLIKTIAGQWPYASGKVYRPLDLKIIPQKPYFPIATLRDSILYPKLDHVISDTEIQRVLQVCCLEKLKTRLDEVKDWNSILSLGEQQRLNFARLIITKPNWILLDEPTASMDKSLEAQMFAALYAELPDISLLTIGHAPSLKDLHTRCITID